MQTRLSLLLLALIAFAVPRASAVIVFTATLTNNQETTAPVLTLTSGTPRPVSFGTATLTLNDDMTELTFTATINNIDVTGNQTADINDNLTNAHIHGPAAPGTNASVIFGFFGSPNNDVSPSNLVVTPFASGVGGTFTTTWNVGEGNGGTTLTAQLPNLLSGQTYLNFHTVQNPGGEIRGQILRVPDPGSSLLLLALGLGSVVALRRRT